MAEIKGKVGELIRDWRAQNKDEIFHKSHGKSCQC